MNTLEFFFRNNEVRELYKKFGGIKTAGSVGYDLLAVETVTIAPMEIKSIDLGVVMKPAEGKFIHIEPRSSTCVKHGIMLGNGAGVIDLDYIGQTDFCSFAALNIRKEPVTIKAGTAIAQAILLDYTKIIPGEFTPGLVSRGGIGSTEGKKSYCNIKDNGEKEE